MAKTKTAEMDIILKSLPLEFLQSLHKINGDGEIMKGLIGVLNALVYNDKEKIVGLASNIETIDQSVKIVSKQNFYSGRISLAVLLHGLIKHAEEEIEHRERKN